MDLNKLLKLASGLQFQLQPLPAGTAMLLDRKVMGLLAPVVKGLAESKDDGIDASALADAVTNMVTTMPDEEYQIFIRDLFSTVTHLPKDGAPTELNSCFDTAFAGNTYSIYELIIEVMRYNKFGPFELMTGFLKKTGTSMFDGIVGKKGETGKK